MGIRRNSYARLISLAGKSITRFLHVTFQSTEPIFLGIEKYVKVRLYLLPLTDTQYPGTMRICAAETIIAMVELFPAIMAVLTRHALVTILIIAIGIRASSIKCRCTEAPSLGLLCQRAASRALEMRGIPVGEE
jgi:hypothetical protein